MIAVILAIGAASTLAYLWRRQWFDAVLVLVATAALAGLSIHLPGNPSANASTQVAPATASLRLTFPNELALGRVFTLTVQWTNPAPGRLQLLAENGQLLAETSGKGNLAVQWLPPVAEKLVLKARVLDADGKVIDQGSVPFVVMDSVPLKVQGRFSAPSFDVRALEEQLVASHAVVDWQVTLGRAISRSDTAPKAFSADLEIVDAAWFEQAAPAVRKGLLARVASGTPLIVLAGNANNAGIWAQALQLPLQAQAEGAMHGALATAPFNPAFAETGAWKSTDSITWTRTWHQGRITWLGAADWHKLAITQPRALSAWWQGVLDRAGVQRDQDVTWLAPDEMPLPNRRVAICAQGVKGDAVFPQLAQTLTWQQCAEHIDARCVAVWPRQPGWLMVSSHPLYIYADHDWRLWQRARGTLEQPRVMATEPLIPALAILFALALLLLWWRERR
ncbi:MAG: hypothetical protein M3Y65_12635 [Pseudomonadota bacterium]|nr:hypothetical protein [Pseudomonadota bacterium]